MAATALRYNQIFYGLIVSAFAAILIYSFFVEPLDGDLTRVGGYNEADFGWQDEQAFFEKQFLFTWARKLDDWKQPYDIIVMGDSFGWRPYNSFTNYLASYTGKKVLFLHHNNFTLDKVISAPQFRKWPPELLVYEVVERRLYRRIQELADVDPDSITRVAKQPLDEDEVTYLSMLGQESEATDSGSDIPVGHRGYKVSFKPRNKYFSTFNDRMSATIHFAKLQIETTLFADSKRAFDFILRTDAPPLFSSKDQDRILIYVDDIKFRNQWKKHPERFVKALDNAWIIGNASPQTRFIPIVFPDKLTVYAEYLEDDRWKNTSLIDAVSKHWDMPRLDVRLAQMVRDGVKDVYLPNDSHAGFEGNRAAAQAILEWWQPAIQQKPGAIPQP